MGRIRRGGYVFEWWIGDQPPRHIHVSDADGRLPGRVRLGHERIARRVATAAKSDRTHRGARKRKAAYENAQSAQSAIRHRERRAAAERAVSAVGGCV